MNGETEPMMNTGYTGARSPLAPVSVCVLAILCTFALFWPTAWSMVQIWERSETFAHGYLILPISLWLIWRKREILAQAQPRPDWRGLVLLALLGFGWLLARVAEVQVVQQLAFVGMLPTLVLACLGWPLARVILFPLLFLFLAVPMGEGLIPPLMDFTALFTVSALRLTGLPVYWEGTYFSIPSGNWSVVEGCSGVRYLIASITMGCLYAYLSYRSYWRRAIFIALSAVVPVLANGLRAYMIVMIAHLSDMKLALGVDHLIYGWVFFGLVMLLLFWIGSWWSEPEAMPAEEISQLPQHSTVSQGIGTFAGMAVAGLLILLVWPAWSHQIEARRAHWVPGGYEAAAPAPTAAWQLQSNAWLHWKPRFIAPDQEVQVSYQQAERPVGMYLAFYGRQKQNAELINSQNVMVVQKDPVWRQVENRTVQIQLQGQEVTVRQSRLVGNNQKIVVWHWYWLEGTHTANDILAKLIEARNHLLGGRHPGVGIVLYTAYDNDKDDSEQRLQAFMNDMLQPLEAELARLD